eukprot:COSAG06_NODE_1704_length_8655_cov_104.626812_5_plen_589_part_00
MPPPPMPAWLQAQNAAKQRAVQGAAPAAPEDPELAKLPPALRERLAKRGVLAGGAAGSSSAAAAPKPSGGTAEDKAATLAALQAKIKAGLAEAEIASAGGGGGSGAPAAAPAAAAAAGVPPAGAAPGQWVQGRDPASGYPYWYNQATGQSSWQQPAGWVPPVAPRQYQPPPQQQRWQQPQRQQPQYQQPQRQQPPHSSSAPPGVGRGSGGGGGRPLPAAAGAAMGRGGRGRGMAQTQPAWMTNPTTAPSAAAATDAAAGAAAADTGKEDPAAAASTSDVAPAASQDTAGAVAEEVEEVEGWRAVPDPENPSEVYYWNASTGETTWDMPQAMQQKQQRQQQQQEQKGASSKGAGGGGGAEAEVELVVGQQVEYEDRARGNRKLVVRLVHIERAVGPGEEPFYTIELPDGGGERQTERSRLRVLTQQQAPPQAAAAAVAEGDDPDERQDPAAAAAAGGAVVVGDDPDERQDPAAAAAAGGAAAAVEGDDPDDERQDPAAAAAAAAAIAAATAAVVAPPNDNPNVFFDINIGGLFAGRIVPTKSSGESISERISPPKPKNLPWKNLPLYFIGRICPCISLTLMFLSDGAGV